MNFSILKKASCYLIFTFLYLFPTVAKADSEYVNVPTKAPLLAVVDIVNNSDEHKAFVSGMPDMLITELLRSQELRLVERTKIHTAMKALKIEVSELTQEGNLKLGQWLGADGLIVGAFNKLGENYRLDIRVIDVTTGTISFAASATKPYAGLLELVPEVGFQLRERLAKKYQELRPLRACYEITIST